MGEPSPCLTIVLTLSVILDLGSWGVGTEVVFLCERCLSGRDAPMKRGDNGEDNGELASGEKMRAMGFEPMQLSLRELESRSLDHSDTRALSCQRRLELAATRPKSNGGTTSPA